ncbi:MAG: Ribosomal RNA small subunit methyltransferase H [Chlamydiia bacterium]|nr:Ribosomal RNA small subunit methyltransferase H [Chlamydiia bacterium]
MLDECLELFRGQEIKVFYEGTLGAGGHAEAILREHPEIELYIGCDQDTSALALAKERLSEWEDKVVFIHDNFSNLDKHLSELGVEKVDGFFLTWGSRQCSSIKINAALAS